MAADTVAVVLVLVAVAVPIDGVAATSFALVAPVCLGAVAAVARSSSVCGEADAAGGAIVQHDHYYSAISSGGHTTGINDPFIPQIAMDAPL